MSTQVISVIIGTLSVILPYFNIHIAPEGLEQFVQVLVQLTTGAVIWYQRTTLQKAPNGIGDIKISGIRK